MGIPFPSIPDFLKKKPTDPDAPIPPKGMRWSPNLRRYEKDTGQPEGQGTPATDPKD